MARVEVIMPKMGESITEGTIIAWHKQVGDSVEVDETLLEIGTDKVDTEVPAVAGGVLAEIIAQEGDTVDVGTAIAVIETEADAAVSTEPTAETPDAAAATPTSLKEEEAPAPEPERQEVAAPAEANAAASAASAASENGTSATDGGTMVDVVMPKMGESIMEGTITAWHKKPGDAIEVDETLLEIATDKVDTEVPSPAGGVLAEIVVAEGDTVEVGTVIARIGSKATAGVTVTTIVEPPKARTEDDGSGDGAAGGGPPVVAPEPIVSGGSPAVIPRTGSSGQFFSPLVRSMAQKEGVSVGELEAIGGSGRDGRITKRDMIAYLERRETAPAASPVRSDTAAAPAAATSGGVLSDDGRVEIIEMDRMRQIISKHMIESKRTSAHVTSFAEADVTNLVKLRSSEKEAFQQREGIKLTFTPFFVKAAVDALREHPLLNSSVDDLRILVKKDYHVGIAVAIGKTGLVVPVIRDAGHKNIAGLARASADLADRARTKRLQPDELSDGTFTVTNIGSLGSIMGTPIISQPQTAILATGAIKKRPVVVEDPDLGDIIAIRQMMYVSMSYDHRIIDGAMAASFLQHFVATVESFKVGIEL